MKEINDCISEAKQLNTSFTKNNNNNNNKYKNKTVSFIPPSLVQGSKFKDFQQKKTANKENMLLETFENNITFKKDALDNIKQEYTNTLNKYNNLITQINVNNTDYINRISKNNQYLNKYIRFTTGQICYVTNQGVVKLIPNNEILNSLNGINGCPNLNIKIVEISLPWVKEYNIQGNVIPLQPPLVIGTNMQLSQSCGLEGLNVYVNNLIKAPESNYLGCYNNKQSIADILFVPIMNSSNVVNGFTSYASSTYLKNNNTFGPWNAFTRNNKTYWHSDVSNDTKYNANTGEYIGINKLSYIDVYQQKQTAKGEYLQIKMPGFDTPQATSYTLTKYDLQGRQDCCGKPNSRSPNSWLILGYNNNTWYQVDNQTNQSLNYGLKTYEINNPKPYQSYVCIVLNCGDSNDKSGNRTCVQISIWNLYTNTDFSQTNNAMNYIQSDIDGFVYVTFDECQEYALTKGYKYFGIQDSKLDGTARCLVSNDLATSKMYGNALTYKNIALWSSNINDHSGISAILTHNGSLSVLKSGGSYVYSSPYLNSNPSNYLGCYLDNSNRAMTMYNNGSQKYNYEQCKNIATQNGYKLFGLQNSTSGTNAQCTLSNSIEQTHKYGKAGNCKNLKDGTWSGGGWSNAVYNNEEPSSFFYLILQDDGNMCIYRGQGPNDNQGLIWSTMTAGQQKMPNANFTASKSKFSRNYMISGETLGPNEFLGSTDGSIYLIMQTDGNVALYTSTKTSACSKSQTINNDKITGNKNANAIYELKQTGYPKNIGKVAFIDEDTKLHAYEKTNIKHNDTYTEFKGVDSLGYDIVGSSLSNTTLEQCKNICNNNSDCTGFVTNSDNSVCWPKTKTMNPPDNIQINKDRKVYVRNSTVITPPLGATTNIVNIDSIYYENYLKDNKMPSTVGLANTTRAQQEQLTQLQDKLNALSSKIVISTNEMKNKNDSIYNLTHKNLDYLKEMKNITNKEHKLAESSITLNIDNILHESDKIILHQNYKYLIWSFLAVSAVLITVSIKNK